MYFKQFYLGCLAHASYLIGDEKTGRAVVVDPQRDVDQYIEEAGRQGMKVTDVFLTHFHADFVSGHLELKDKTNATIHMGAKADPEYNFQAMADGDKFDLGDLRLEVLETPGHTPESVCYVVYDLAGAKTPKAVLTGDTLFIGDVGRPDLVAASGSPAELAGTLYDSIHNKILPLPDETLVYPAHGAGSMCGKNLSKETVSTLGAQRKLNYALQAMSKEDFVSMVTADQPDAPPYFSYDAMLNRKERETLDASLGNVLRPLTVDMVLEMKGTGAQLLDVRDPGDYAAAHLEGTINIGLGGQFASWSGIVLDRQKPIVIIAEPEREREAAMRLGRIGFDHVAGYLGGGMSALATKEELVRTTERVSAADLETMLAGSAPPVVLDVRSEREWQAKHIAGSINVPLNKLKECVDQVPRKVPLVIHCAAGYRSSIAASLLRLHDIYAPDLIGGIGAWEAARKDVVSAQASRCQG